MKRYFLRLIPLLIGLILLYLFGNESRSTLKIISLITILLGWYIFYLFAFRNKQKLIKLRGFIFLISLLSVVATSISFEHIVYGDNVSTILKSLNNDSPKVITTIKDVSFQGELYYKRRTKIPSAWVYEYEFKVEGTTYNGASSFKTKLFNIGDTVEIIYYKDNPKINKINKN